MPSTGPTWSLPKRVRTPPVLSRETIIKYPPNVEGLNPGLEFSIVITSSEQYHLIEWRWSGRFRGICEIGSRKVLRVSVGYKWDRAIADALLKQRNV